MKKISLKGKKILITGGLGFIGSNLAHTCVNLGAKVSIYDCLDPKSGGNMRNIKEIEDKTEIILNDIRNFGGISQAVRHKDIVFNCAAYTSHPKSMEDPLVDIDVNCKGVIYLLEAGRRFNPDMKIVHVGTSTQVGKMLHDPIDELHPEFPVDIYSANKTASEKYVLIYGQAYKMKTCVVRLPNVYGPRSNIKSGDFGFINYFIGLALQKKKISVFGKGRQIRSIVYVDDAVQAMILAALSEKSNNQVYFVCDNHTYTVSEIAKEIVSVMGGKVHYGSWPGNREAIEIGDAVINNLKIKRELKWHPKTNFATGLLKTKDYFSACLQYYTH